MELLLAFAVITAVIIFGALISLGNERQRKAIDELREHVVLWALQDLRIKREHLARDVRVDDPISWLNQLVTGVYGKNMDLTVSEIFENPQALLCTARDSRKVVLSPVSPKEARWFQRASKTKLSRIGNTHPFMELTSKVDMLELSALNSGILFDLELQIAWKILTRSIIKNEGRLFIYVL